MGHEERQGVCVIYGNEHEETVLTKGGGRVERLEDQSRSSSTEEFHGSLRGFLFPRKRPTGSVDFLWGR